MMAGCSQTIDGYTAASTVSANGFARMPMASQCCGCRQFKLWGYVDQLNIYGNAGARELLGPWWSGEGPDSSAWRFNLKARAEDGVGQSFAVYAPDDPYRDRILSIFAEHANRQTPIRVFLKGRLSTFEAPNNITTPVGLYMELGSSQDILIDPPSAE